MITNELRNSFDKFYTKTKISNECFSTLLNVLNFISLDDMFFIEPSAGNGKMLDSITSNNKLGFDILPEREDIIEADFLKTKIKKLVPINKIPIAFCNPPFGKKSKLAISFVNKLLQECQYVCAILPVEFNKYSVQKQINKSAKLIYSKILPSDSFTFGDADKNVNCCFQIWTTKKTIYENLRIITKPLTEISDFQMFQYNCTEPAKKYFDYKWNFAVLRQGYNSLAFTKKYFTLEELKQDPNYLKKQWIFFNTNSEKVLKKLLKIDFQKLSEKNTSSAKGFGKADVIEEYTKTKSNNKKNNSNPINNTIQRRQNGQ